MKQFARKVQRLLLRLSGVSGRIAVVEEKFKSLADEVRQEPLRREPKKPLQPLLENESIRVLFILQHSSIWTSWRSTWEVMEKDDCFNPRILLTPFLHPSSSGALAFDDTKNLLLDQNIPFGVYGNFSLQDFRPHVVFVQNPYDETRPTDLSIEALSNSGVRVCYIPYGLEIGGGDWNFKAQFDLAVQRQAWRIFSRSQRHKIMYGRHCASGNSHVIVTGHPKFDQPISRITREEDDLAKQAAGKKVILWTPHFSVGDPPTWSTFKLYSKAIFEAASKFDNILLIIRPHPLFFRSMENYEAWDNSSETEFRIMIETSPRLHLDESPDYTSKFLLSDALLTDAGSFLLEYLPSKKPILYLQHLKGLGLNDDGDLIHALYCAAENSDIQSFFKNISCGIDPKKELRIRAISEFLFGLDGKAGNRISDHIKDAIKKNDLVATAKESAPILQSRSEVYWKLSNDSFLAPPEYYFSKEEILKNMLNELPAIDSAIDIGCGNGRYTEIIGKVAKKVKAYDISAPLIEQAKIMAQEKNIINIQYYVSELDSVLQLEKFELVSFLGVTSCVIDDLKFLKTLDKVKLLSKEHGYVIFIDTLSTAGERIVESENGYTAKYRNISDYKKLIERRSFDLVKDITIKEDATKGLVNSMFLFRKHS